jgi:hypothetical protein
MQRMCVSLLALVAFLLPPSVRALAREKPTRPTLTKQDIEQCLETDWYGVYMLGNKVGYAKFSFARTGDKEKAGYVMSMDAQMNFIAAGAKQEIRFSQSFEFDGKPPFAFRKGNFSEQTLASVKKTELTRKDQDVDAIRTVDGNTSTKQLGALDYTLADELAPRLWVRNGPKIGDRLTSRSFDPEKLDLESEFRKLVATKTSVAEGVKVTYHEVEMTSSKIQVATLERYNSKGSLLSGVLGGVIELRAENEQLAKDIGVKTDLFLLGTVKIDRPLGEPARITSLTVKVNGKEANVLKSGPRQTIERTDSGNLVCKTGKDHGTPVKATDKEIEENLLETNAYPIKHAKVQVLVKEAIGDAQSPKEKVDRLVHFVAKYITGDYNTRPRSLLHLLELRKGACTEFALLFTTLARAAGIPAREVTGLYYMGDDSKAFGPHAWNEVVLDGHWVPIDATWNEIEINATHISFGSNRTDEDLTVLAKFLSTFGKLSFKLLEVRKEK